VRPLRGFAQTRQRREASAALGIFRFNRPIRESTLACRDRLELGGGPVLRGLMGVVIPLRLLRRLRSISTPTCHPSPKPYSHNPWTENGGISVPPPQVGREHGMSCSYGRRSIRRRRGPTPHHGTGHGPVRLRRERHVSKDSPGLPVAAVPQNSRDGLIAQTIRAGLLSNGGMSTPVNDLPELSESLHPTCKAPTIRAACATGKPCDADCQRSGPERPSATMTAEGY
jgi:hypothetical protein